MTDLTGAQKAALIENDAKYGYIRRLGFSGPELGYDGRLIWESPLTTIAFDEGDEWIAYDKAGQVQDEGYGRDQLDKALDYTGK